MRITTDDGVELATEVEGSGPGLVLVHGFGGAKEDFCDHTAALARDHTVVTFDHRGHGESDKPADRSAYSLDRLAADTMQVADATGLDTFRLLGHSMGGMVARKVVLRAPDRVEALVMMDTCAGPVEGLEPELMDAAADVAFNQGKDAVAELLAFAQALETPAYRRAAEERPWLREFDKKKWADLSVIMWGTLALELAHQSDDLAALAAGVRGPVLVIVGEQDAPFLPTSHAMAGAIAGAQLVVLREAGHSPQFESPQAWRAALTEFLAAVPVRGAAR